MWIPIKSNIFLPQQDVPIEVSTRMKAMTVVVVVVIAVYQKATQLTK